MEVGCGEAGDMIGAAGKQAADFENSANELYLAIQDNSHDERGNEEPHRRREMKEIDTLTAVGNETQQEHQLGRRVEAKRNLTTEEQDNGMKWSPIKRVGHKRPLEELEEGEVDSTEERAEDDDSEGEREEEEESEEEFEAEEGGHLWGESGLAKEPVVGQLSGALGTPNKMDDRNKERPGPNGQGTVVGMVGMVAGTGTHRAGEVDAIVYPEFGHLDKENPCPEAGHAAASRELHARYSSIASHRGKKANHTTDTEMTHAGGIELSLEPGSKRVETTTEIIRETQFHQSNRNIYNDILASIGLDSPTTSQGRSRGGGVSNHEYGQDLQRVSTPIRNSASSLIALGKYVLTPRQGRLWDAHNKSPLGG